MKKYISLLLVAILTLFTIVSCGSYNQNKIEKETEIDTVQETIEEVTNQKKFKIVTTIFPVYDWVMSLLQENAKNFEVSMLLDNGVDLHNFQPTVDDILMISNCDLFVYVGGESDSWVDSVLNMANNKNMKIINLLEALGDKAKNEEIIEGMEHEEDDHNYEEHEEIEENDTHDKDEHAEKDEVDDYKDEHDYEEELDEHIWLSLKNASLLCDVIANNLTQIDAGNKSFYESNLKEYKNKLKLLDDRYEEIVSSSPKKILLFGDRFPFRYMVDDYGLNYYAAFSGCSAETEASFETIVFLSEKLDENNLDCVITIEGTNNKIAQTIIDSSSNKNRKTLTLDSMQGTTQNDVLSGASYLNIMEKNLEVLKEALK